MSSTARTTLCGLYACVLLVLAAGCESNPRRAREEAAERWNVARAQVKAKLAADQFESGNFNAASNELAEAYRLNPDNPDLTPLRVRVLLADGRLNEADQLLAEARAANPTRADLEYLLGVLRQQQERWAEALDAYLVAVDLMPTEIAYPVAVAQVWLQLGQPDEAIAFLETLAPRFGWTNAYQAALAESYEQVGNWSAAASAWQRVVYAEGSGPDLNERLAEALFHAQRYVEVIPVLESLVESADGEGARLRFRLMLADCYLAQGRSAAALAQAQAALRVDRENLRALRLLAQSYAAMGDYWAALRTARQALARDAHDVPTLELTVGVAWRTGDQALAAQLAARLLSMEPENPVALSILRRTSLSGAPPRP